MTPIGGRELTEPKPESLIAAGRPLGDHREEPLVCRIGRSLSEPPNLATSTSLHCIKLAGFHDRTSSRRECPVR